MNMNLVFCLALKATDFVLMLAFSLIFGSYTLKVLIISPMVKVSFKYFSF
ncbi:hypothetical protein Lalb_Chr20g0108721 [Lupinus albus]|uniref:Uncharacterized protein n=1 Tax=Lupinus albus TaxID=3870 RepID=A0A6A4NEQ2_LUPAL|nr:hypothetical protein Lalb_Chr20g0108721 [Lupinus albus]